MRAAVIDVGTNTTKLVVGEAGPDGTVRVVHESITAPRLGEGFGAGRTLSPQAIERTVRALREQVELARSLDAESIRMLATSAAREAANGDEFVRAVKSQTGADIEIISGEEESRLSFASVALDKELDLGTGEIAVVDVGGGSTEMATGSRDHMAVCVSIPIGAVKLHEEFTAADPPGPDDVDRARERVDSLMREQSPARDVELVVGVGGSAVNLARIVREVAIERTREVHGVSLGLAEISGAIEILASRTVAQRRKLVGLDPDRADIILAGVLILERALARYGLSQMTVSVKGMRYGALYEMLREVGEK